MDAIVDLGPSLRITDSHAHVWAREGSDPAWRPELDFHPDTVAPIEQLLVDLDAAGVADAVLVQPSVYAFDDTYMRRSIAIAPDRLRGVMLVDPLDPDAAEAIKATALDRRVTGLRMLPLRSDRGWFGPGAERIWKTAAELALTMTFLVRPDQIPAVARWAQRFRDVAVVIDHLGRPDLGEGRGPAAIAELLALASLPNVYVKLSAFGSVNAAASSDQARPGWLPMVTEAFGVDRVMWGSDYPWVLETGTIGTSLAATVAALPALSHGDAGAVFGRTARRLFGFQELDDAPGPGPA